MTSKTISPAKSRSIPEIIEDMRAHYGPLVSERNTDDCDPVCVFGADYREFRAALALGRKIEARSNEDDKIKMAGILQTMIRKQKETFVGWQPTAAEREKPQ